jgi:23S rRNA pseudouridine1911/1915/1917 synthase
MLKFEIIHEEEDYLVINKPAGLPVHGAEHMKEKTLADELMDKYPNIAKVGEDPYRPGIVHRLDKQVSGLLLIAKNNKCFESFKEQFQKRTIKKTYIGLVYGRVSKDEDLINFPIQRSAKGHKMAALPATVKGSANEAGRRAETEFIIKQKFINYTLLEIVIKTGRTHQIRVHMSAYGHPLVGDDLYGTRKTKIKNDKLGLGRIFLTASKLEFDDLQGKRRKFEIDLPEELSKFLEKIK